ncbi:MAG: hypothetical protein LBL67_04720 [Coriobacteriales bacterium]|jgi:predicted transcriptional regulator|nr:hypothetical protein [Coriobacteriales bacterium]
MSAPTTQKKRHSAYQRTKTTHTLSLRVNDAQYQMINQLADHYHTTRTNVILTAIMYEYQDQKEFFNQETVEAMCEADQIAEGNLESKVYANADELFAEIEK